jgi:hypothetical protein
MNELAIEVSMELRDELDSAPEQPYVDPRTIPTRFSLLKKLALSPAHYLEACQAPQDDSLAARLGALMPGVNKRNEALRFGTAVHLFLLGDVAKVSRFSGRRAGKAWTEHQAKAADEGCIEILNDREWVQAKGVAEAIKAHELAMKLLLDGTDVEKRIDWSWMGKQCRSTPDARSKKHMVDLKTAQTAQPHMFTRAGERLYYHCQAAFYLEALEKTGEPLPEDCFIIAVEKTRPHPVTVMRFDTETLELGAKQIRLWFEQLLQCESANKWPVYVPAPAIATFSINVAEPFAVEIDGERVEV